MQGCVLIPPLTQPNITSASKATRGAFGGAFGAEKTKQHAHVEPNSSLVADTNLCPRVPARGHLGFAVSKLEKSQPEAQASSVKSCGSITTFSFIYVFVFLVAV